MLSELKDDISDAELQELAIAALQTYRDQLIREKKAKGGRYPNSFRQKAIATTTIRETQPWTKPRTAAGKARSAQNNRIWITLEFSAPNEEALNQVTAPVRASLQRFRKEMRDRNLGTVKVEIKTVMQGVKSSPGSEIFFKFDRTFKIRLSKYQPENQQTIAALFQQCTNGTIEPFTG